jgi:hypothetical protein
LANEVQIESIVLATRPSDDAPLPDQDLEIMFFGGGRQSNLCDEQHDRNKLHADQSLSLQWELFGGCPDVAENKL